MVRDIGAENQIGCARNRAAALSPDVTAPERVLEGYAMKLIMLVLVVVIMASVSEARTWRVNTAGTGDAPTLHAAMDSAAALDVVLVEAGEYALTSTLHVPRNVRLVGESGPGHTLLYRDAYLASGVVELLDGATMSGVHVRGNTSAVVALHDAAIDHCIVEALLDVHLVQGVGGPWDFRYCLFIGGEIGLPAWFVACIIMSDLDTYAVGSTLYYNDVLGSVHPGIDASSTNANFSLDPEFCGIPGSGNYFLRSTSPCLAENNPFGIPVLVGPLAAGCGAVVVEERTWGAIKALYREH
jgi:hypothetical protein